MTHGPCYRAPAALKHPQACPCPLTQPGLRLVSALAGALASVSGSVHVRQRCKRFPPDSPAPPLPLPLPTRLHSQWGTHSARTTRCGPGATLFLKPLGGITSQKRTDFPGHKALSTTLQSLGCVASRRLTRAALSRATKSISNLVASPGQGHSSRRRVSLCTTTRPINRI